MKADLLPGERVVRFDGPSRCDGWSNRLFKGRARRIVSRRRSQVVRQRSAKPPSPVRIRAAPFLTGAVGVAGNDIPPFICCAP
jgi:hypothetical protein